MSITINGTTNTLTAASGLTIAGNTAVTGTLSATSGSGNAVIMNHTNSGAVGNPVQRSGVTKGYLGLDVSDNFGLLDSAGTLRAAVSTTGLAVTGLLDLSAASSGQIKFPATQNASADANTLDDYEEGNTTPTITSAGGTPTTVTATGRYTKVGRLVVFSVDITMTDKGTATGAVICPLPFTAAAGVGGTAAGMETAAVGFACNGNLSGSQASMQIYKYDFTTPWVNGGYIRATIAYHI